MTIGANAQAGGIPAAITHTLTNIAAYFPAIFYAAVVDSTDDTHRTATFLAIRMQMTFELTTHPMSILHDQTNSALTLHILWVPSGLS